MEDTVAFTVALNGQYSPSMNEKIPYNNIITNIGSGYITQSDEFVCPPAGAYVFYSSTFYKLDFYKNEEMIGSAYSSNSQSNSGPGSNMFLFELQEAETVSMRAAYSCTMHGDNNYCTFSGVKIV